MNIKLLSLLGAALLSTSAIAFAAKDAKAAKEPKETRKAPDVLVDNSPLSDTRTGVVTSYADIVEPVQKTVVSVYSKRVVREQVGFNPFTGRLQGGEHEEKGLGSGVIISPDGYILTNNHVVEGADELKVSLPDDRELVAKVIGTDPKTDIAVIKIEADKLPAITFTDSDKIRVGDVVFAIGNPLEVGQTVTMGIVSAKGRNKVGILDEVGGYENFIQTDAAINMGNSGGPLVDAKGRLVGINSAILSPSRGSIGIGFAIPSNLAASIMRGLIEHGAVVRGYLGVNSDSVDASVAESLGLPTDTKGVVINDILPGTPAEKAGLKLGDVIVGMNDKLIASKEEMRWMIAQMTPGSVVKLKILRKNKEQTVEATLGKSEDNPDALLEGVNVSAITDDMRRANRLDKRFSGLIITKIAENSPYADRLSEGMLIVQIDGEDVTDLESARKALDTGKHSLLVAVGRGSPRRIPIEIK